MCGGRGQRLGAATKNIPKPLTCFNKRTILEIKIEQYLEQGFDKFIFCIGYKGELIREKIAQLYPNINADYSDAGEDAGILKRLYIAKNLFGEQVILTYGDTFTDLDTVKLKETHQNSENEATIVVAPFTSPFGLVEFDKNNKVTKFQEKPTLNYYIGHAMLNQSALDAVPKRIVNMSDGEGLVMFYSILAASEKLGVYYHPGLQITFNTPEELKKAEHQLIQFYTHKENANEN